MNISPRACFLNANVGKQALIQGGVSLAMRRLYVSYRDRSGAKQDGGKDVKVTTSYSPLREALKHRWSGVPRRQTKNLNPAAVFIILGRDSMRPYLATGCSRLDVTCNSLVGVPKHSAGTSPRRSDIRG